MRVLKLIFDWSEVWAPLIPIVFYLANKKQPKYNLPIVIYVFLAFFINLFADIIADFKNDLNFPEPLQTNSFLYNAHSIVRFTCFSTFFILLRQPFVTVLKKVLQATALIFSIVYFSFENFNNPNHISGDFLAIEAFLLLVYCLLYYLYNLKEDTGRSARASDFFVVTGLSIYVVINFFVFLFYIPMITADPGLANQMWNVHNIAYIILCIFIAKAFYSNNAA